MAGPTLTDCRCCYCKTTLWLTALRGWAHGGQREAGSSLIGSQVRKQRPIFAILRLPPSPHFFVVGPSLLVTECKLSFVAFRRSLACGDDIFLSLPSRETTQNVGRLTRVSLPRCVLQRTGTSLSSLPSCSSFPLQAC